MERRAEKAAEEWRKAKATWRGFARVIVGFLVIIALFLAWAGGYVQGAADCIAPPPNRPESVTP